VSVVSDVVDPSFLLLGKSKKGALTPVSGSVGVGAALALAGRVMDCVIVDVAIPAAVVTAVLKKVRRLTLLLLDDEMEGLVDCMFMVNESTHGDNRRLMIEDVMVVIATFIVAFYFSQSLIDILRILNNTVRI